LSITPVFDLECTFCNFNKWRNQEFSMGVMAEVWVRRPQPPEARGS